MKKNIVKKYIFEKKDLSLQPQKKYTKNNKLVMYAIVEIAGKQFKVEKGRYVYVNRLDAQEESKVAFDNVLLIDSEGKVTVGTPKVNGAKVEAKVLQHLKGDKVLVFKKRRRKGYQTLNGHRDCLTKILIEEIVF